MAANAATPALVPSEVEGPKLRFALGDRVSCNMGPRGWAAGTVVALHYREEQWPEGKTAPYQVELDAPKGALIFAPMDMNQVVRALTAGAPQGTASLPAEGDAEAALRALEQEMSAVRSLQFIEAVDGPRPLACAESKGELIFPAQTGGPWSVAVRLLGPEGTDYSGVHRVNLKVNSAWPKSAAEVRFHSLLHHGSVEDDGLIEAATLADAIEAVQRDEPGAAGGGLVAVLRAVHALLRDPAEVLPGADGWANRAMFDHSRQANAKRNGVINRYAPQRCHPELFDERQGWPKEWFDPAFWQAREQGTSEAWKALMSEESWEVYSFPMFTEAFCARFVEEMQRFTASGLPARRPNSMNNYGIVVNEIGMEPLLARLQKEFLQPIAHALFPGAGSNFDHHHSFVVRYKVGEDLGLDMHTDDSDVTFNICLGIDFKGAGLQFCGNQGTAHHRHASTRYYHVKGRCVVHLGHRRHGADDITEGERLNLIVWNKNSEYRKSKHYKRYNMQGYNTGYEREQGKPDPVCLSFTHDRDYGVFKPYTERTSDRQGRGWCPPPHSEYAGFRPEAGAPDAVSASGSSDEEHPPAEKKGRL